MAIESYFDIGLEEPLDPLGRAARVVAVKDTLQTCLDELDRLGLSMTGAHLSMALHTIERDT